MVNAVGGHKNPAGASVYSSIAGDAWYRAQLMLQDQKIGHYMHIPPRAVFFSQIFGLAYMGGWLCVFLVWWDYYLCRYRFLVGVIMEAFYDGFGE